MIFFTNFSFPALPLRLFPLFFLFSYSSPLCSTPSYVFNAVLFSISFAVYFLFFTFLYCFPLTFYIYFYTYLLLLIPSHIILPPPVVFLLANVVFSPSYKLLNKFITRYRHTSITFLHTNLSPQFPFSSPIPGSARQSNPTVQHYVSTIHMHWKSREARSFVPFFLSRLTESDMRTDVEAGSRIHTKMMWKRVDKNESVIFPCSKG